MIIKKVIMSLALGICFFAAVLAPATQALSQQTKQSFASLKKDILMVARNPMSALLYHSSNPDYEKVVIKPLKALEEKAAVLANRIDVYAGRADIRTYKIFQWLPFAANMVATGAMIYCANPFEKGYSLEAKEWFALAGWTLPKSLFVGRCASFITRYSSKALACFYEQYHARKRAALENELAQAAKRILKSHLSDDLALNEFAAKDKDFKAALDKIYTAHEQSFFESKTFVKK